MSVRDERSDFGRESESGLCAKDELAALGYKLKRINGKYEEWQGKGLVKITFNVYDGEQVAKIETFSSHAGSINSRKEVYKAMIHRMEEREAEA